MKTYTLHEAEAELRAAIDADDAEAITRLGQVVDDLDVKRDLPSLEASALWYVSQGLKVFPLSPGSKIPFKGTGGCLDASSDPEQVRRWWSGGNPRANIGVATGHLVDVIDIDGIVGQKSRLDHWDMIETLSIIGRVSTPRPGGAHLYVPASGKGNKAGILPAVDYRGVGGYVVAPPSVITIGDNPGRYSWTQPLTVAEATQGAA